MIYLEKQHLLSGIQEDSQERGMKDGSLHLYKVFSLHKHEKLDIIPNLGQTLSFAQWGINA